MFFRHLFDAILDAAYHFVDSLPGLPEVSVSMSFFDLMTYILAFTRFFLPVDTIKTLTSLTLGFLVLRFLFAFLRFLTRNS